MSSKTHFATIIPKPLKSVKNLGSKRTNQQMAKLPERFTTPRTVLGSPAILLRSVVRIL